MTNNQITTEEFIEKYVLVNGKHIKLSNAQKEFIKWLQSIKSTSKNIINMMIF